MSAEIAPVIVLLSASAFCFFAWKTFPKGKEFEPWGGLKSGAVLFGCISLMLAVFIGSQILVYPSSDFFNSSLYVPYQNATSNLNMSQKNITASYFIGDGSFLTNINASAIVNLTTTETDPKWTSNLTNGITQNVTITNNGVPLSTNRSTNGYTAKFSTMPNTASYLAFQVGGTDKGYLQWNIKSDGSSAGQSMILNNLQGDLVLGSQYSSLILNRTSGSNNNMQYNGNLELGYSSAVNTQKAGIFFVSHYNGTSQLPMTVFYGASTSTDNIVSFGGSTSSGNAATDIFFNMGATQTSGSGTQWLRVNATKGAVFLPFNTSTTGLTVKGTSGQTANLQEWQNDSGNVLANIDSEGRLGIGSGTATSRTSHLLVAKSITTRPSGGAWSGAYFGNNFTFNLTGSETFTLNNMAFQDNIDGNFNTSGNVLDRGLFFQPMLNANITAVGASSLMSGVTASPVINANGNYVWPTVEAVRGFITVNPSSGNMNITTARTYYARATAKPYAGANITNSYVFFADNNTAGFNNYGIWTGTGKNNFGDSLNITGSRNTQQLVVKGGPSQTVNLQEWQNITGSLMASINKDGVLAVSQNLGTNNAFIGNSGPTYAKANSSSGNVALGNLALESLTTGSYNFGLGYKSLNALTTAQYDIGIGGFALASLNGANADGNIGIGYRSGYLFADGDNNVMIGGSAGYNMNNTVSSNVLIGSSAGYNVRSDGNTFVGTGAGLGSDSTTSAATRNSCIGYRCLYSITTGTNNLAMGYLAGDSITAGSDNFALGYNSLSAITSGNENICIGSQACENAVTPRSLTAIGYLSGRNAGSSNFSTMIGPQSGFRATGNYNVLLGYQAGYSWAGSNALMIDVSDRNDTLIFGDFSNRYVTINGKLNTTGNLSTAGNFSFTGSGKKVWTKYSPNSLDLIAGTGNTTNITNLTTMGDTLFYTIGEGSGTPGIDARFNFTNVNSFGMVRIAGAYAGSTSHAVGIQLYDYVNARWVTFNSMQNSYADITTANGTIINNEEFTVYDASNYISGGNVTLRMYHTMTGNPSHNLYLDEVSLRQ